MTCLTDLHEDVVREIMNQIVMMTPSEESCMCDWVSLVALGSTCKNMYSVARSTLGLSLTSHVGERISPSIGIHSPSVVAWILELQWCIDWTNVLKICILRDNIDLARHISIKADKNQCNIYYDTALVGSFHRYTLERILQSIQSSEMTCLFNDAIGLCDCFLERAISHGSATIFLGTPYLQDPILDPRKSALHDTQDCKIRAALINAHEVCNVDYIRILIENDRSYYIEKVTQYKLQIMENLRNGNFSTDYEPIEVLELIHSHVPIDMNDLQSITTMWGEDGRSRKDFVFEFLVKVFGLNTVLDQINVDNIITSCSTAFLSEDSCIEYVHDIDFLTAIYAHKLHSLHRRSFEVLILYALRVSQYSNMVDLFNIMTDTHLHYLREILESKFNEEDIHTYHIDCLVQQIVEYDFKYQLMSRENFEFVLENNNPGQCCSEEGGMSYWYGILLLPYIIRIYSPASDDEFWSFLYHLLEDCDCDEASIKKFECSLELASIAVW